MSVGKNYGIPSVEYESASTTCPDIMEDSDFIDYVESGYQNKVIILTHTPV